MLNEACRNTTGAVPRVSILQGTTSVAIDLVLFLLPLPALWQLCLPFKQKVGIFFIFFAAFDACISSIGNLIFLAKISGGADNLLYQTPIFVTGIVEIVVGLLVPCTVSFMRIYRSWQVSPALTVFSANRSSRIRNRSKTKRKAMGRDELVMYSTTASSQWREMRSSSMQEDVGNKPKELSPIHDVRAFDVDLVHVRSTGI